MPDYIPAADAAFDAWQDNFMTYAGSNLAALGLVAGDLAPLTAAQTPWKSAYLGNLTAQNAAVAARALKDASKSTYTALIRDLVRRLQAAPAVDDTERANLGITVPGMTPPPGPPTTAPIIRVECQRLRHILAWADSSTPTSRARPAGTLGAEIWLAIRAIGVAAPTDPAEYTFISLDTRTPYTLDFDGPDGGKNAHYLMRWVGSDGSKGPWSETVSVTIGA